MKYRGGDIQICSMSTCYQRVVLLFLPAWVLVYTLCPGRPTPQPYININSVLRIGKDRYTSRGSTLDYRS